MNLLAAIASVAALTCAGVVIGALLAAQRIRRRESAETRDEDAQDLESAGILAVAYVRQKHVQRWVPATIVQLACTGKLVIIDGRNVDDEARVTAFDEQIQLELAEDLSELVDTTSGEALVLGALFGRNAMRGTRVTAVRDGVIADRLRDAVREGFGPARQRYFVSGRASGLITTAFVALCVSVLSSSLALAFAGLVLAAVGIAIAGIFAIFFATVAEERAFNLTTAGKQLRDRARRAESTIGQQPFDSLAMGERILPWAVLFDQFAVVDRFAHFLARSRSVPDWYAAAAPFSAARLVSCLETLRLSMSFEPSRYEGGAMSN